MEVTERPGRRAVIEVARDELVVLVFELESGGAGPHLHRRHVDSFYGLEGELELYVGDEVVHLRPGTFAAVPPGVVHSFDHSGPPVRFLNFHTPGMRFDEYMRRMDAGEDFDHAEYDAFPVS